MRISDEAIFQQQVTILDNQEAVLTQLTKQASTGKSLFFGSDAPQSISADLSIHTQIAVTTQVGSNLTNLSNELTSTDGALASLTNVLQNARSIAIGSATDVVNSTQLQDAAQQVDGLLQESVGLANTRFAGSFVFGGTSALSSSTVQTSGAPISSVTPLANNVQQTQLLPNGQSVPTNVTLQQAFNVNATNGSPSVFQTLINLRDALNGTRIVDQSAAQVNVPGTAIAPATTVAQLSTGAAPQLLATPLTPDASANVSVSISSAGSPNGVTFTFTPATTVGGIIAAINAQTAATGVTAAFNTQTQRLVLTGTTGPFQVRDVPSPGSATASNFTTAFGLQQQASTTNEISTQLGDIDNALNVVLGARAQVGATIQASQDANSTTTTEVNNETAVQSNLEDVDIAHVTTQLSLTQTALQAAEDTTARLEQNTSLFNFLQGG